jgi:hypothetical protein
VKRLMRKTLKVPFIQNWSTIGRTVFPFKNFLWSVVGLIFLFGIIIDIINSESIEIFYLSFFLIIWFAMLFIPTLLSILIIDLYFVDQICIDGKKLIYSHSKYSSKGIRRFTLNNIDKFYLEIQRRNDVIIDLFKHENTIFIVDSSGTREVFIEKVNLGFGANEWKKFLADLSSFSGLNIETF